jgi:hypothetical protein
MRRWFILAAILLGACSGCGAMEDFILGPDPYIPEQSWQTPPPPSSCNAPPPITSVSQTQEPPLSQKSH